MGAPRPFPSAYLKATLTLCTTAIGEDWINTKCEWHFLSEHWLFPLTLTYFFSSISPVPALIAFNQARSNLCLELFQNQLVIQSPNCRYPYIDPCILRKRIHIDKLTVICAGGQSLSPLSLLSGNRNSLPGGAGGRNLPLTCGLVLWHHPAPVLSRFHWT